MAKSSSKSGMTSPWWLSSGEEQCSHCGQIYAYEVELRCSDCDGAFCPHCRSLHISGRIVCPSCIGTNDETKGASHG